MKTKLFTRLVALAITGTAFTINVNAQGSSSSGTTGFWDLTGNSGTNTGINFVGTTDAKNLNFRTNNIVRMTIGGTNGFVGIGNTSPGFSLDVKNDSNCTVRLKSAIAGNSNMVIDRSGTGFNCLVNYRTAGTTNWQTGCVNNTDFSVLNAVLGKALTILNSNNNVGIGTTAPDAKLHVVGNGGRFDGSVWVDGANANTGNTVKALQFGDFFSTGEAIGSKRTAGGNQNGLDFYTNSLNRMIINNSGNVGIGTQTPSASLAVKNTSLSGIATTGSFQIGESNITNLVLDNNEVQARSNGAGSTLYLQYWGGNINACQSGGSTTFSGPLNVTGANVSFGSDVYAYGNTIVDAGNNNIGSLNYGLTFGTSSGEGISSKRDAGGNQFGLDFYTASANRMSIANGGNVGIGTTAPSKKLHVVGDAIITKTGTQILTIESTSGSDCGIQINRTGTGFFDARMTDEGGVLHFRGSSDEFATVNNDWMILDLSSGNVGIGVSSSSEKLSVCGTIRAKELHLETGWCDYVFADKYNLKPLEEVAAYIKDNKHLPGIETAKEVETNGLSVAAMSKKMMEKIEELTLYVINQNEQIKELQKQNSELQNQINNIKK